MCSMQDVYSHIVILAINYKIPSNMLLGTHKHTHIHQNSWRKRLKLYDVSVYTALSDGNRSQCNVAHQQRTLCRPPTVEISLLLRLKFTLYSTVCTKLTKVICFVGYLNQYEHLIFCRVLLTRCFVHFYLWSSSIISNSISKFSCDRNQC